MIEYCLQSVQCDPDVEIKSIDQLQKSEDDSDSMDVESASKPKETSIFSLLLTVPFIDKTAIHPLELFLKNTKNVNVLHHETQRTPLLQSIFLEEHKTAHLLLNETSCDVNLSTSIIPDERHQTPLILACKLRSLSTIHDLLNHKQCNILTYDYQHNQGIHYYLATSNRTNQYLDILNLFIVKIKLTSTNNLNTQGKYDRTPLHTAVYHNSGTIDAITDVEQILIDHGSDLMMKDNLGNIPLHNVFLNKKVGDDPVELCVLITKAMKYKSLDTRNNAGNTPLHLAVVSRLSRERRIFIFFLGKMFNCLCNAFTKTFG
jgi:ankyrin repeat protein